MSEAEVTAINQSITARDAALAKLQGWYNTELITITKNEGQKRTEYTATEKVQNEITERLETAALKFQGQEIQRIADRLTEIKKAETDKNTAIQVATNAHNLVIQTMEAEHTNILLGIQMKYDADLFIIELQHKDETIRLQKEKEDEITKSWKNLKKRKNKK